MKTSRTIELNKIVAFTISEDKAISGKVVEIHANGKVKIETLKGQNFTVSSDRVIWVKTKRWPNWVYKLLKGGDNDEQRADKETI